MNPHAPLSLLLISALLLSGCATTKDPLERALLRGQGIVENSHVKARGLSERGDGVTLRARYNPCQCEAPPVELHLYGAWRRHLLAGEQTLLDEFSRAVETPSMATQLFFLRVSGRLNGQSDELAGIEYPVFYLESFTVD